MKASLSWLNAYVDIRMDVVQLTDALTMAGLEVESVADRFDYLKAVRVGRILHVNTHPNADKLKICEVDFGEGIAKVVCGASNVRKGMLAPLALAGTQFPNGTVLRETSIRGAVSQGMLCSEQELGLSEDGAGIMALDPALPCGQNLMTALGLSDAVLEIGVTPNRPDCLSLLGIAREIAGIQRSGLRYPDAAIVDSENRISEIASVAIEAPDHCPRYAARLIVDVTVGASPPWLRERLLSVGLRPINNIVDVTNFVLMETGQPLHAFDFDHLSGHRIVVKTAENGHPFITLDQKERHLSAETLMICDGEKYVAIGGVMGGLNSEISETTTRVFLESAYFNPRSIRRTAKRLGISTEASHRFERGVDPEGVLFAMNRAARLMVEVGGGRIIDGWLDVYPKPVPQREVTMRLSRTNRLLGTDYTQENIKTLLEAIAFSVTALDADRLQVRVPTFRVDVERPEDLMEEAARLSGYAQIPVTFPTLPAAARKQPASLRIRGRIRQWMVGFGFLETLHYSFIHSRFDDRLGLSQEDFRRSTIQVLNPISEDQSRMRTTLIPGLLGSLQRNLAQQIRTLRLFEIGKVYLPREGDLLPQETETLAVLWTGLRFEPGWFGKETPCDFFDIKGVVEGLLKVLGIGDWEFSRMPETDCAYLKSGAAARIRIADQTVGQMGQVNPGALESFDIRQSVYIAELDLDALGPFAVQAKQSAIVSRYPAVTRDFTLIVDKSVPAGDILKCVTASGETWVESVRLFDVFEEAPVPRGKKSISFRITYRSRTKTLEDAEVTRVHQKLSHLLLKTFDAALPE